MSIYVYNTEMNRNIIDFVLLAILILVIYIRNDTLVSFFNSILGRFILILLIISLSLRDTLWGLLALLLLIIFRESYVEGMQNISQTSSSTTTDESPEIESLIDPKDIPANGSVTIKDVKNRTFTETVSKTLINPKDVTPSEWRKENCSKDNKPMFNNKEVSFLEIPDLFSNFSFVDQPCNPCDISCNFKISSAAEAVSVSENIRSKPSNQTIVGPSRDGNGTKASPQTTPTDGTSAGSGSVQPITPIPMPTPSPPTPDSSKITPAPTPGSQTTDMEQLKQACDYKDSSKCIFESYVKQGDNCVIPGSPQSYNAPALANYNTTTFVQWLQGLFNRNQPGTNDTNYEANEVYNYWNKCKSVPGNEYLNQLNLNKPNPPAATLMDSLPNCVVSGVTVPGWKQLPDGNCIAPKGQKCCNEFTYKGQPVCQANFQTYDVNAINGWISGCIQN